MSLGLVYLRKLSGYKLLILSQIKPENNGGKLSETLAKINVSKHGKNQFDNLVKKGGNVMVSLMKKACLHSQYKLLLLIDIASYIF